uniref:Uncharacterized protein n=1 Tax=Ditylenchus dipsaci TaxID=166011 RepID=A0A915E148_9BILA
MLWPDQANHGIKNNSRLAPHRPSTKRTTGQQILSGIESSVQIEDIDEQEHWEPCRVLGDAEIAERRQQRPSSAIMSARNFTTIEVPDLTDQT